MRRNLAIALIPILSLLLPFRSALAQEPSVDVLVAVAPGFSALDPLTLSGDFEFEITQMMLRTGRPDLHFNFRPYLVPVIYTLGATGTGAAAVAEIEDDVFLNNARDTGVGAVGLGITSYDLVVVIVPALVGQNGSICGNAGGIPLDIPPEQGAADNKYVAVVSNACADPDKIVAHEIGHLLGGNHQLQQSAGPCPNALNEDCFPFQPVSYNHPVFDYDVGG